MAFDMIQIMETASARRASGLSLKTRTVERWIRRHLEQYPARAGSLIVTVYGDFIAPHGGTVWLGSLIRLVAPLGLNERVVRTCVYRLSQENWLKAETEGRRSHYRLTPSGRRRFESAWRRIYFRPEDTWSGEWQLVFLPAGLTGARRDALRKELVWSGYGALAPGVLAHPSADHVALRDILHETGTHDHVVTMKALSSESSEGKPLKALVHGCWNLATIAARYRDFIDGFRPVLHAMQAASTLDAEHCFLVQTLLMHAFRRTLLNDPQLPARLLPADWSGRTARQLCEDIYRITCGPAQAHLLANCQTADGPLPAAAPYFYERFGGLEGARDQDRHGGASRLAHAAQP